jgi:hypothetical protein
MGITRAAWNEADKLNERGRALADAGDWDAALSCYRRAVERVPSFEPAWFNMALVHKRRRHWTDALDCNQRAASLGGEQGDPAWWNLGIAATALRRWDVARTAWQRFEVVWGQRIDPARIVVKNVPLPQSGHRWGDIVLHDGAPNGLLQNGGAGCGVSFILVRDHLG